jgi:hypothetical protein
MGCKRAELVIVAVIKALQINFVKVNPGQVLQNLGMPLPVWLGAGDEQEVIPRKL